MCKVMAFTNLSKVKDLKTFVNTVHHHITKDDDDGFGWAALGKNGVFGERTTCELYSYRLDQLNLQVELPIVKPTYNMFGKVSKIQGGGIFHGRTSTNHKSLLNTHPIIKNGWTLIHNGVVNNNGTPYKMETSNDTEHLVHYMSTEGISAIERHLSGYYAFCAFDPNGHLHIVRDSIATLYIEKVPSLKSFVIATTVDLIEKVCEELGLDVGPVDAIQDDVHMIFEGNALKSVSSIKPLGYGKKEERLMEKSLHYLSDEKWNGFTTYRDKVDDRELDEMLMDRFDPSLEVYLRECEYVNDTFTIYDEHDRLISTDEFRSMSIEQKLGCIVIRPDGTWLTPEECCEEKFA